MCGVAGICMLCSGTLVVWLWWVPWLWCHLVCNCVDSVIYHGCGVFAMKWNGLGVVVCGGCGMFMMVWNGFSVWLPCLWCCGMVSCAVTVTCPWWWVWCVMDVIYSRWWGVMLRWGFVCSWWWVWLRCNHMVSVMAGVVANNGVLVEGGLSFVMVVVDVNVVVVWGAGSNMCYMTCCVGWCAVIGKNVIMMTN